MAIEKDFLRQVMGQFVTGVTVVTTSSQGVLAGLTVNAFCSVSLDPPLVLVCVDLSSTTLPYIHESGSFVVNILTSEQEHLSRCFATSSEERYEYFCHANYHVAATGSPVLDEALAFIDARVVAEYPAGDHVIFLGQVEAIGTDGQVIFANEEDNHNNSHLTEYEGKMAEHGSMPLVYYRGQYRHLEQTYRKPSLAKQYDKVLDR